MRKQPTTARFRSRYSHWHRLIATALMLAMSSFLLAMPAMARSTYVITDGSRVVIHSSFTKSPELVLAEAGLALSDSDTYTTQQDGIDREINIRRNQRVRVYVDNQLLEADTYGAKVLDILNQLGVRLGPEDRTSQPLNAATYDGMYVLISRVTHKTVTYQEVVKAQDTVYYNNVLLPGQETVLVEGSDGLDQVQYDVTLEDGREIARRESGRESLTPVSNRVVIRGQESAAMPVQGEGNTLVTAGGETLQYSRAINGKATAYNCPGYVGRTASGTIAQVGKVAVDPKVIPLGTKLYVVSQDGQYVYGYCVAEDTGGLIKGNKVDLYFATWDECIQFGYRPVTIYVVA